ncbi:Fungalysin metallopeptidase-domain-containing protein [Pisolithus microcarpus]|nr:Fungalysin metallopeptidase-domain-containing protein [Pisolithus microcarpus]
MRGLTTVTLALAGLAAHAIAHSTPPPLGQRRKTLGFGPVLPHARFETLPPSTAGFAPVDPFHAARDFLDQFADPALGRAYAIRSDSYTDRNTGVTHVYARQIIGGIEVADAHINLNIKDGRVLSFGDSFFPGGAPALVVDNEPVHPHAFYCSQLRDALLTHQSLLVETDTEGRDAFSDDYHKTLEGVATLTHLYDSNCAVMSLPPTSYTGTHPKVDMDPRRPLLEFMAAALPKSHPAFEGVLENPGQYVEGIGMVPETHLLGDHATVGMALSGVPGTIGDVKARITWVQVPKEDGSVKLELVHRFEVEMQDNWYEATVTAALPHRIISVVDWASDSPMPPMNKEQLPPLAAFVPSGTYSSVGPAPKTKPRLGKAAADRKKGKNKSGAVSTFAPVPKKYPAPPKGKPAEYLVFPWGTNDPLEAVVRREQAEGTAGSTHTVSYGRMFVPELGDTFASPAGWHTLPYVNDPGADEDELRRAKAEGEFWCKSNATRGNNVFAQENWDGRYQWINNHRAEGSSNYDDAPLQYVFTYDPVPLYDEEAEMQQAKSYIDATVTQLFYTTNMFHDLVYRYGFTEEAGNFQQYNFGRGGLGDDAVIANAQDGSGFNNANFMTPPDGQNGRCRMYLWNTASPYRDGDMEAGIVIHELSHGLSTRLTGGPQNSGCLGWGESGGMGEGWGDFIATTVRSTSNYSDYTMGAWASNRAGGIRNFPYSTTSDVNPSTYATLDKPGYWGVHAIGEVWAEMLWVVSQKLIEKYDFSPTLLPPVPNADGSMPPNDFYRPQTFDEFGNPKPLIPKHGNTLFLQLVIEAMKLQPCSPTFFDARKAILNADKILTGGENECEIWEGFASRGMGVDAKVVGQTPWGGGVRTDGIKRPDHCLESDPKKPSPEPKPKPDPIPGDDECGPFGWCWPWKGKDGQWRLPNVPGWPWSYDY